MRHLKTYTQLFESRQELTDEQKEFLDLYTKGKWIQNPKTGLVDVKGVFDCSRRSLKSLLDVQFGHVSGVFNCSNNQLVSLEGAPQSVGRDFYGHFNQLITLNGAPQSVGEDFYCDDNQLTSLEGAPQSVGGVFYCHRNQLTTLEGAPQSVNGVFYCDVFQLDAGEWNVEGWLKAAQESEEAAKLLVPLIPEQELDTWMRKHPLDLDLLNGLPEIKSGVLKRTGVRDVSKLAAARRRGMV